LKKRKNRGKKGDKTRRSHGRGGLPATSDPSEELKAMKEPTVNVAKSPEKKRKESLGRHDRGDGDDRPVSE